MTKLPGKGHGTLIGFPTWEQVRPFYNNYCHKQALRVPEPPVETTVTRLIKCSQQTLVNNIPGSTGKHPHKMGTPRQRNNFIIVQILIISLYNCVGLSQYQTCTIIHFHSKVVELEQLLRLVIRISSGSCLWFWCCLLCTLLLMWVRFTISAVGSATSSATNTYHTN